ncbi:MAG: AAA family ATPase [Arcobacteraceae bacterium]|nr:AAA family ATPase [Arcobacteraceae bacterium]
MFQNLNKNKEKNDKNLKMMGMSAIVLVVLFVYVLIKSDNAMQSGSYYIGVIFLFILMGLAFALQKYKTKIQAVIPKNKFQEELEKSEVRQEEVPTVNNSTIQAVTSNITFKDVAGISQIKEELEEVVDFLNNPKKYKKYDVSLPKGVLLVGPPGVGKTLIARAVAGETNVPFFYQSGASFVHIYVGMGAKRVKELFNEAKAKAPSIIFIDEIDAVGKARGIGSNDEREATLNELLTQMDGFDGNSGVMVIAATNKIEVLDEALLRAGRFDRRVFLTLPSRNDREEILKLYLKGKKIAFELEKLANDTSGFSSAALATLVNEALLNMIKRDGTTIVDEDIDTAKRKIQFGKKEHYFLSEEEKNILATYQAAKAYISKSKVELFDEGISSKDLIYPSKTQLENQITNNLAGSIGVEVLLNEPYAVFESEIKEAKMKAAAMVEKYDMATSSQNLLQNIKSKLQEKISTNKDEILKLKATLLKDEVVVF